jgi:LysR family hydrogen peroxide-inducible transcriptional activator
MLSLNDMQYLVALARENHFGRAALHCNISQPALSSAIAKLEAELGYLLFERMSRGVRITPEGKALAHEAEKVLSKLKTLQDLAAADKDQLLSPINLGCDSALAAYLLPQVLLQFHYKDHPGEINLYENSREVLEEKLIKGSLDALLMATNKPIKDSVVREIFSEPWQLLTPMTHPLAINLSVNVNQLHDVSLLVTESDFALLPDNLKSLPNLRQVSSYSLLRGLVATHRSLGLMPFIAATSQLYSSGKWANININDIESRSICLVWRATYPRHKMMDLLAQAIKSSAEWQLNFVAPEQHQVLGLDFFKR